MEQETTMMDGKLGEYYRMLLLADKIAETSNDPDTKVGAICFPEDYIGHVKCCNRIRTNGHEQRLLRPEKYVWSSHAEVRAIAYTVGDSSFNEGSRGIACTHIPCLSCAHLILSAGFFTVVLRNNMSQKYLAEAQQSIQLMRENGCTIYTFFDTGKVWVQGQEGKIEEHYSEEFRKNG